MDNFDQIDIEYRPLHINNDSIETAVSSQSTATDVDVEIANKLIDHLNLIKEYNDRIAAIDYLSDNAAKLAENPTYTTNDPRLMSNIKDLGGNGGAVDFILFQKAVDIVIKGFQNMALSALTGVNNA